MSIKVWLDMDGTLFNLYGKDNWLDLLENEVPGAFVGDGMKDSLMPALNLETIHDEIYNLIDLGVSFGIISWTPFAASPIYEEICRREKIDWLHNNFPMITDIAIIPYGIEKQKAITKRAQVMYLIDDNSEVCKTWETAKQRKAILVDDDFSALDALRYIHDAIENGAI